MASKSVLVHINQVRALLESLGPSMTFRKMFGILNALEMQMEDGHYQRQAVARLCEALLATAGLYDIPEREAARLEKLTCGIIDVVERA